MMFLIAQFIGLCIINIYNTPQEKTVFNETTQHIEKIRVKPELPYGMEPPSEIKPQDAFSSMVIAILIATLAILLFTKIKARLLIRIWFFAVVILSIGITLNAFFLKIFLAGPTQLLAFIIAIPLAVYKIFERNLLIHNLTELLIYPGIAAVFVPLLNIWFALALLILISIYDIYAVWHAKFMQKLAMFQIKELNFFTGFFVPYISKKQYKKIKKLRAVMKKERDKKKLKEIKLKVNLAILGGGDITFPLIFAGTLLTTSTFLHASLISIFSTISLLLLFIFAKRGKFYPAMPFITLGCITGWLVSFLI